MEGQRKQCSRLILFPLPFQGHINPMLQLANIFYSKGFSITIIHTKFNSPNPSKYPHFNFHPIGDGLDDPALLVTDPLLIIKLINTNCVEPFRNCLSKLLSSSSTDGKVKCIITDANLYFTQSVADGYKVPRIVIRTSSVASFFAFAAQLHRYVREDHISNPDSNLEEPVQELPLLRTKYLEKNMLGEQISQEHLQQYLQNMLGETKKASGLIFNTSKELEEPEITQLHKQFLIPTFTIGPFHKCFSAASSSLLTQDRSSIAWLDTKSPKSVLYVSFGSIAELDGQKLHELAWGLANSMQPFLWVVRPGLVHNSEWLEILPDGFLESVGERGCIIKWAPQQEVLAHPVVGGFWTHSGWNSTLESICEGVPMICSPFFGDQLINSRYVNDVWKIGISLDQRFERGEIERSIRKILVDREGEEMRERILRLKEKVDLGLDEGGSSHQSLDDLVNLISS